MTTLTSFDGTEIWYRYTKGTGPTLVFLHGWVNNWTSWKKEIDFFESQGRSTLVLDLRGHGQSAKPDSTSAYKLERFARDVCGIVDVEKITEFVLLGHSMGGMIALMFVKEFGLGSGCKGLVLCDTTAQSVLKHTAFENKSSFLQQLVSFLERKKDLRRKHFSHLSDIDLSQNSQGIESQIFLQGLSQTPLVSVFACLEEMMDYDVSDILSGLTIPVLVIAGEKDKVLPKIDSIELYEDLPLGELKVIPNGRHFVQITDATKVETFISVFLDKL